MDLIYTDENFNDIGVIQGYTLDMAYGLDENDFELRVDLHKPEIPSGGFIYVEGTEFGGIVDSIEADTISNQLIYRGRTWNGILGSCIIEPYENDDYYDPQGDANEIIADVIERCDLDYLFSVDDGISGVDIELSKDYNGLRYEDVNYGLFLMLQINGGKLMMSAGNGCVKLWAEPLMNYAATEELDSSQVQFTLKQVFAECNHLICLGSGQLKDRYVIHLFTDAGGGIQPFLKNGIETATKDDDYILDKSMQVTEYDRGDGVMVPLRDYAEVYDYPDVETVENYELLDTEPFDWNARYRREQYKGYTHYYEKSEDGESYDSIEPNIQDVYDVTTSWPSDWNTTAGDGNYYVKTGTDPDTGEETFEEFDFQVEVYYFPLQAKPSRWNKTYMNYYLEDGSSYKKVEKVPKYTRLTKKPNDWAKKYGNYYLVDEFQNYSPVQGESKQRKVPTTSKPSDWASTWKSYYIKKEDSSGKAKYVLIENDALGRRSTAPKWKKNTYYSEQTYYVTPKYRANVDYYSKSMVVPKYEDLDRVFKKSERRQNIQWVADTYYTKREGVDVGVPFEANTYYRQVLDHYAGLVEGGQDRLKELNAQNEINITLKQQDKQYNIGDIVGGVEELTGLHVEQPISKKIVKIANDVVDIEHQVIGGIVWG